MWITVLMHHCQLSPGENFLGQCVCVGDSYGENEDVEIGIQHLLVDGWRGAVVGP